MALSNRSPLQVSPKFKKRLDDLQRKIMFAMGEKRSLREITENIIASPLFNDIENDIIKSKSFNGDIRIKFDMRRRT